MEVVSNNYIPSPLGDNLELIYTSAGELYANLSANGQLEIRPLGSRQFLQRLERRWYELNGTMLSNAKMRDILRDSLQRTHSLFTWRIDEPFTTMGSDILVSPPKFGSCTLGVSQLRDAASVMPDTLSNNGVEPELSSQAPPEPLFKVRLLVPLHDNDGVPIEPALLGSFERKLADIAGGWSDLGPIRGGYIMPDGSLCIDWNQVYEVAVPGRDDGQQLISLLHDIGARMGQHSICYDDDPTPKCYIVPVANNHGGGRFTIFARR